MRILFVWSRPEVASQVKTAFMDRPGVEFVDVATPQRAIALLEDDERFDLVIGDNDTAPTGGYYLAREIRARGRMELHAPPVVLLLARAQDIWLANWSQADAYVLKPVDPFDLAEAVDAVVEGRPLPALPGIGGAPTPSLLDAPSTSDGPEAPEDPGTSDAASLASGDETAGAR